MITPVAWVVHAALYPAFAAYLLLVTDSMAEFDGFLADTTDYWELRYSQLDTVEHARV